METTNVAIQVLDELSKKFGLMVDWSQQNIQPYVQDLVGRVANYEIGTSLVWSIISLFAIVVSLFAFKKIIRGCETEHDKGECILFGGLLLLGLSATLMVQIFDIIRCFTLPEMVFVSYIQNLMA